MRLLGRWVEGVLGYECELSWYVLCCGLSFVVGAWSASTCGGGAGLAVFVGLAALFGGVVYVAEAGGECAYVAGALFGGGGGARSFHGGFLVWLFAVSEQGGCGVPIWFWMGYNLKRLGPKYERAEPQAN